MGPSPLLDSPITKENDFLNYQAAFRMPKIRLELSCNKTIIDELYPQDGTQMTMLTYKEGPRNCEIKITRREWEKL